MWTATTRAQPVTAAWTRMVSGELSTQGADDYGSVRGQRTMIYAFTAEREPSTRNRDDSSDRLFANVVGHGQSAVGFCPDMSGLLVGLVCAADHRVTLAPPSPRMLSEAPYRLTAHGVTVDLTTDEAARVTPRLLRLSVRPGQDADAYMRKLRDLLAGDQALRRLTGGNADRSRRTHAGSDRLHGMDEAVSRFATTLRVYGNGERPWGDVDRAALLSGPPRHGQDHVRAGARGDMRRLDLQRLARGLAFDRHDPPG